MGRPSIYSDDIAEDICEHIATGGSLASWCAEPERPSYATVFRWLSEREGFQEAYTRAREVQGHFDADQQADVRRKVEEGVLQPDQARVIIDSLKWTAGRRAAKYYGDKLDVAVSGDLSFGARLAASRTKTAAPDDVD